MSFEKQFEFATATRIIFGRGKLQEAGPIFAEKGSNALVVTGSNPIRAEMLLSLLEEQG